LENLYGQVIRLSIAGCENPKTPVVRCNNNRKSSKANTIGEIGRCADHTCAAT
jgi:hypothetical protein